MQLSDGIGGNGGKKKKRRKIKRTVSHARRSQIRGNESHKNLLTIENDLRASVDKNAAYSSVLTGGSEEEEGGDGYDTYDDKGEEYKDARQTKRKEGNRAAIFETKSDIANEGKQKYIDIEEEQLIVDN